tara:strand:- start:227 stop:424 length:198 start_codon:yes stop_codon:yes gene_type:complete
LAIRNTIPSGDPVKKKKEKRKKKPKTPQQLSTGQLANIVGGRGGGWPCIYMWTWNGSTDGWNTLA